jgi:putative hydrolase of the HAD superfamily
MEMVALTASSFSFLKRTVMYQTAMKQIKHFSFDLWLTLIKSNPDFKKERAHYFYTHFNTLKKPLDTVVQVFKQVDGMCNAINEKTGGNIRAEEMYLMVIYQLNETLEPFAQLDMDQLYNEMERLVFNYMPCIFSEATYDCLDRLRQQEGVTLNILSNTAFIKGATLRKVNEQLRLSPYFDFQLYSDETGVSKPNKAMYQCLLESVAALRNDAAIGPQQILHIGDNPLADIQGARSMGLHAFQINSNGQLITHLFN